jgi:hypothetical protein
MKTMELLGLGAAALGGVYLLGRIQSSNKSLGTSAAEVPIDFIKTFQREAAKEEFFSHNITDSRTGLSLGWTTQEEKVAIEDFFGLVPLTAVDVLSYVKALNSSKLNEWASYWIGKFNTFRNVEGVKLVNEIVFMVSKNIAAAPAPAVAAAPAPVYNAPAPVYNETVVVSKPSFNEWANKNAYLAKSYVTGSNEYWTELQNIYNRL